MGALTKPPFQRKELGPVLEKKVQPMTPLVRRRLLKQPLLWLLRKLNQLGPS